MFLVAWRFLAIAVSAATFAAAPLLAQNGEQKANRRPAKGRPQKDAAGRIDEVVEAGRVMTGPGPLGASAPCSACARSA